MLSPWWQKMWKTALYSLSTKRGFYSPSLLPQKLFQCWKLCGCVNCGVDQKMDGWPGTPIISSLESSSLLLCVSYSHPSSSTIIYICYSNNIQPVNTHFFYAISNYLPCTPSPSSIFCTLFFFWSFYSFHWKNIQCFFENESSENAMLWFNRSKGQSRRARPSLTLYLFIWFSYLMHNQTIFFFVLVLLTICRQVK